MLRGKARRYSMPILRKRKVCEQNVFVKSVVVGTVVLSWRVDGEEPSLCGIYFNLSFVVFGRGLPRMILS